MKNDNSTYENSISELKVTLEKNIVECIQELTKQDLEYTVEDFMKMLAQERRKSNHNYVFDNTGKNFQEDFNRIKSHMLQRNAPDAQLSQLNLIYDKYISYLNFIKYQEESEGIEL